MKKSLIIIFLFIFILIVEINAQQSPSKDHSKINLNCKTCHTCDVPTKNEPCLVVCPRERIITVYQKPEQTPELFVIDQISNRYGPVYFAHKIHAQMSIISGGCENCHHHNTSGPILQCNSCHEPSRQREDVSLPDLKGAYHRQCMDCHREWSHETGCNSCHTLRKNLTDTKLDHAQKQSTGKNHPVIVEPTNITYQTNSKEGKLVTFYHDDHTKIFGLKCTSCHQQENCSKCHDVNKAANKNPKTVGSRNTLEEHHKNCVSCHSKEEKCSDCHSNTKLESFDHEVKAGWILNKHHITLPCVKCHGSKPPYEKVDSKCSSCHKGWNKETFKHSVTGLQLDEIHLELSCEDCHVGNDYSVKPGCSGCHDNFVFPKQKPGKLIIKH
jgi:hypothetical protein